MALYTDATEAAARLAEYTGLVVPATADLTRLVEKASELIEEYIGYAYADVAFTENVLIDRSGLGQLIQVDPVHRQVKSLTSVAVPASAQYTEGLSLVVGNIGFNAYGMISIDHVPIHALDLWQNPVAIYQYPQQLTIAYTAGPPSLTVPGIFAKVCIELMLVLILRREDTDMAVSSKIDIKDMGLETENTFLRDPLAKALHPLARYKKS